MRDQSGSVEIPLPGEPEDPRLETLRALAFFLRDQVIRPHRGNIPPPRAIAVRVIVLLALLFPDAVPSLAAVARRLGYSRAWLSKVGLQYADRLNLRAGWQQIAQREARAARAKAVHRGEYQKGIDRQVREAREANPMKWRAARAAAEKAERAARAGRPIVKKPDGGRNFRVLPAASPVQVTRGVKPRQRKTSANPFPPSL